MRYDAGSCDVAVVGAGHAGIEAALAAARLGLDTVCFTINMDAIGNMPCNPAIGGTGKGHLVRELDALGGEMARAADRACIQYRMLNRGKGPAVHSLRAQADRRKYQAVMKHTLELQPNLRIKQAAGAEHLLTQLFFDNMHFYRFLNLARRAGITLPVSAGVMPIVKRSQIERTVSLSSASLPSEFTRMISRYQDDPASLYDAGIDYAVRQLRDLIEGGADGIHLYAMNDAAVAAKVYDGIRDLL